MIMAEQIIFYILAFVIVVFSILAVTSKWVIRSATYLLFVLIATAGLYLLLNFHYLFAVQIAVYAGGIMVLFIMAIFLTHKPGETVSQAMNWKITSSAALAVCGLLVSGYIIVKNIVKVAGYLKGDELNMQDLGHAIMGTQKYQYILPFEVISVLLLACIIGAILIARKETDQDPKENPKDK